MISKATRFVPVADRGLLVEFATEISDEATEAVLLLDRALAANAIEGVTEIVPAFVNLLVVFDPMVTDHHQLEQAITDLSMPVVDKASARLHEIPVCYDDDLGIDLAAVAQACQLSVERVIERHLASELRVGMYGFAPGYAYMSGVDHDIQVPRKAAPVPGVPAGRVLIAGPQCLITTIEMPTGWSIIGSSPTRILLDGDEGLPVLFDVGDRVRFTRIDRATHDSLATL